MAFIIIMDMLESKMVADPPTTQSLVASAMYSKLSDYWVHLNKSSTISAIINSSHKLDTFYKNIDDIRKTFEDKYKSYLSIKKLYCIKDMTDILVTSNRQLLDIYPTDDDWKIIGVSIFYFLILKDC